MIGQTITHYRVLEKIGQGGMGEVYLAEDTTLDRKVALKFLPILLEQDTTARQRFLREAKSAAALDHPYVCHIHEVGEHEGRHFIAMEYVAGQTLAELLVEGPLPLEEALQLATEIAEALEKAHSENIVHRDLKPANIVITTGGHAKVMDFGLAKRVLAVESGQEDTLTELTREGSTLGTVPYMSPEQVRAEEVDLRTDIFSFGIILYEMLTGLHPFRKARAMDTATAILRDEPASLRELGVEHADRLHQVVVKSLEKEPARRYPSAQQLLEDLRTLSARIAPGTGVASVLGRPRVLFAGVGVVAAIAFVLFWFLERQSNIDWARGEALPEIERLVESGWRDSTDAFVLALAAEEYIPDDPRLTDLFSKMSLKISIRTEPAGADVFLKEYASPSSEWVHLGVTPLDEVRMPIGFHRWKFEKEGYKTVLAAAATWDITRGADSLLAPSDLVRTLDPVGSIPDGMVRVQGGQTPAGELADFFIDKFEVTNRQYKEFVDGGGYQSETWWQHSFVDAAGIELSRDEAMARFIDQTGRPGPSTWQAGDYPRDQANFPVTGISWYEAAAFTEFAGKSLPTATHWGLARGEATSMIRFPQLGGYALFAPFSNFGGEGPVAVGSLRGITPFGAYDMAGNVREWCFNETGDGRVVRGGAWDSATYMFPQLSQLPMMDRSPQNGFRCALYGEADTLPAAVLEPARMKAWRDYRDVEPVSDEIFAVYRDQFSYDPADLNAEVEWSRESDNWVHEKVGFDAAYGGERMLAHLFLPRNAAPPYQTVIYFPGSGAIFEQSSDSIDTYFEFSVFTEFLVKNGRALLFPIYKGTFERPSEHPVEMHIGHPSRAHTDWVVQMGKDFRRSVDYLETRPDIDASRLAYYGLSWGGWLGGIIPAIDERIRASVLLSGGLNPGSVRPEVDMVLYLPRITTPTLMLNGRYDMILPPDTSIRPMFALLGTPAADKELKLYETDHIPPRTEFIRETLAWLDRYLGPVRGAPE